MLEYHTPCAAQSNLAISKLLAKLISADRCHSLASLDRAEYVRTSVRLLRVDSVASTIWTMAASKLAKQPLTTARPKRVIIPGTKRVRHSLRSRLCIYQQKNGAKSTRKAMKPRYCAQQPAVPLWPAATSASAFAAATSVPATLASTVAPARVIPLVWVRILGWVQQRARAGAEQQHCQLYPWHTWGCRWPANKHTWTE